MPSRDRTAIQRLYGDPVWQPLPRRGRHAATADAIATGAVHELTHYIYDRAPAVRHLALIEQFVVSAAPRCWSLYLPHEVVAIAAQGLYAETDGRATTDEESYRHPYIAPLGAVTIALVKDAVARKATLLNGFTSGYIAAGTAALKTSSLSRSSSWPRWRSCCPMTATPSGPPTSRPCFRRRPPSSRNERAVDAFPDLNLVRFARYDSLGDLDATIPGLPALRSRRGFAYAVPRGRGARTCAGGARHRGDHRRDHQAGRDGRAPDQRPALFVGLTYRLTVTPRARYRCPRR